MTAATDAATGSSATGMSADGSTDNGAAANGATAPGQVGPAIDPRWRQARNVLLIRLDNLGDVLVTTPAFRALHRALPAARLTLLASPVGAQAGRLNPDLDEVVDYEAPWMDPWQQLPHDPARELTMVERLRAKRYDAAVIFTSFRQSPLPAAYLCYLAGIPLRVAASLDGPGSLLTTRHKHPERMMHEVERGLDLVAALGVPPAEPDLVLRVPDAARAQVAGFGFARPVAATWSAKPDDGVTDPVGATPGSPTLPTQTLAVGAARRGIGANGATTVGSNGAVGDDIDGPFAVSGYARVGSDERPTGDAGVGNGGRRRGRPYRIGDTVGPAVGSAPLVVVHPGCSMPARTYAADGFAAVAGLLVGRLGARVIVTGSTGERALVEAVVAAVPTGAREHVVPCAGELAFPEFCALIERADLVVTNNTGPMHVAAALKTPVVALFALTNPPEQWRPWRVPHRTLYHEVPCRLCYSRVCPYTHDCLRLVTPEDVLTAATELLTETAGPVPEGARQGSELSHAPAGFNRVVGLSPGALAPGDADDEVGSDTRPDDAIPIAKTVPAPLNPVPESAR